MQLTKKELRELLKEEEKKLEFLKYGFKKMDEYLALRKQIDDAQKAIYQLHDKWDEDHKDELLMTYDNIKDYTEAINNKGELNPLDYSDDVQRAFKTYHSGSTWGPYRKLIWVSDDERYALFKIPSHTGYCDRMTGNTSSPNEWELVDVAIYDGSVNGRGKGLIWRRYGGRFSKKFLKEIEEKIKQYEDDKERV